jgi:hypothetical protein
MIDDYASRLQQREILSLAARIIVPNKFIKSPAFCANAELLAHATRHTTPQVKSRLVIA